MQATGFDYTDSFSPVETETPTRITTGIKLFHKEEGWASELCDMEAKFLHQDMPVEIFIECPEGIVDRGITTKEFLEEYCILLGNLMYGNMNADLLWLRILAKYLNNECNITGIKVDYSIFYKKYDSGKLELVMSVHIDDVFMAVKPETPENFKEMIDMKFNIKEQSKDYKFIGV